MTTAAKYGALDLLTPNAFNLQQLAAPTASTNTVVNVTATNRNASDTRVRLALTSVPLNPQVVTASTAMIPFQVGSTSATGNVLTTQPINLQASSTSVFTTQSVAVHFTTQGTNTITCFSTQWMYVGMPVVFSGSVGGLTSSPTYYILTIPSSTTFTVSLSYGGPQVFLTSAFTSSVNVSMSTAAFSLNQPVTFNYQTPTPTFTANTTTGNFLTLSSTTGLWPGAPITFGGTTFSNVLPSTQYYVNTVMDQSPIYIASISRSLAVVTVNTGWGATFSALTSKQWNSTASAYYITFSIPTATIAPLTGINYVVAGNSNTNYNGTFTAVASSTTSITLAYTATDPGTYGTGTTTAVSTQVHGLTSGQSVTITGITALGITDISNVVVTVATTTQFTFNHGSSGTVNLTTAPAALVAPAAQITITATQASGTAFAVGASSSGTMTSTVGGVFGSVAVGNTYFIKTLNSSTTFGISATSGGSAITLTALSAGFMQMYPSTISLALNQPVYLQGQIITFVSCQGTVLTTLGNTGNLTNNQQITFYGYTYGGVQPGVAYYVTVLSAFTISLSLTSGGTAVTFNNFSYPMYATTAIGTAATSLAPLTTYYVNTVPSLTTFTVSAAAGTGTAITLGNISQYTATVNSNMFTLGAGSTTANLLPNQPVLFTGTTVGNAQTLPAPTAALGAITPFIITATTSGSPGYCTTTSTVGLVAGQPIQFYGNTANTLFGTGITANTVYYVLQVLGSTTFSIASSYANYLAGTGLALSGTSGTMYVLPSYYVGAITSSTHFTLLPSPQLSIANTIQNFITTSAFNSNSQAQLTVTGQPLNTDYLEYDALIASNGILERTGVLMPPNTYLYASTSTTMTNVIAVGITEAQ